MDNKKGKDDITQEMTTLQDSNQTNDSAVTCGNQKEKTATPWTEKSEGDEIKAH